MREDRGCKAAEHVRASSLVAGFGQRLATMLGPQSAHADEGGISVWLPGTYGSFAAVPGEPGWSFATLYIHPSVDAGGD